MELKRDLAIVLRSVPFEDRHRVVTAITENHGQISALARNAIQSRRFGGTLELFAAAEWTFADKQGAELCGLRDAVIRRSFEGIRADFDCLSLASVLSELMLKVAPQRTSAPELFRLHSNSLAVLEERGADLRILNTYLAKLLQWNGTQPRLQACSGCAIPLDQVEEGAELTCLVASAGWLCSKCRRDGLAHVQGGSDTGFQQAQIRLAPLGILDFQVSVALPIRQASRAAQAGRKDQLDLFRFLEALLAYHLPGLDRQPLKALRFLGIESSLSPQPENPPRNRPLRS